MDPRTSLIPDSQVPSDYEPEDVNSGDEDRDEDGLWPRSAVRDFLKEYKMIKIDHLQGDNLWHRICVKLKKGCREYTVKQLKNKRDLLWKQFRKEQAKKEKSGEGASNWEWYDAMYEIMQATPSLFGIPNAADNGQSSTGTPSVVDLNRTPPMSMDPPPARNAIPTRAGGFTVNRIIDCVTSVDSDPGDGSESVVPGIRGRAVQKGGKSPVSNSIKEVANAVKSFTTAFVEAKKRKAKSDDRRTKLLEDLFALKRR
ncbi:hypothetical protein R1flu_003036 [Riccia fluitans]|uniref:MADF domain-containing protein n=1 Tax=Riccia fluitans TaxID=41844 RepID=A0ABD1Y871_9MARC